MSALDTLKDQLDAAWEQIQNSALHRELARQQQAAWDNNEPESRLYLRLDDLHAAIFETAALLADDDIKELTATIANEKDETMTEYRLPKELEDGPLWNSRGDMWTRFDSDRWVHDESGIVSSWLALLVNHGPLTTTPPTKVGDTGLTAEQVWDLPKGTVIWPERAENPEPWMRWGDTWRSISEFAGDAGSLQCAAGDSFRVLILGGDK